MDNTYPLLPSEKNCQPAHFFVAPQYRILHICRLNVFTNFTKAMKIKFLAAGLACVCFGWTMTLQAQQDPYFTHFAFNKLFYNPAAAGESGKWCVNAVSHQQWRGYDDRTRIQDARFSEHRHRADPGWSAHQRLRFFCAYQRKERNDELRRYWFVLLHR